MKKNLKQWIVLLAALMVLAMGIAALAEGTQTETAAQPEATEAAEAAQPAGEAEEEAASAASDEDALYQEALEKYRQARQGNALTELEEELKQMVEQGQLTQDQADLLLTRAKAQAALASGVCPNCGESISAGGKGNGMGGRMGRGRR